ncbi:cryptococcal mannosyltransferase 1-domain-containing protein [Kockovaella imperatae]|uniref:Cryptococcal mannosyltransferase 1-domain-containing protein n=1 Tax=Kockovaella imperatae TaxID=4999 RepID=A0A1Y1UCR5_9TREE|nr:cryptococcal mannosyltransferase 1-domain-containing protein [Kockovaella imperatae]ORX35337.1 cryptococcal mannosyltransferase 1-domain-containing protein [Kockovaella imperatae]
MGSKISVLRVSQGGDLLPGTPSKDIKQEATEASQNRYSKATFRSIPGLLHGAGYTKPRWGSLTILLICLYVLGTYWNLDQEPLQASSAATTIARIPEPLLAPNKQGESVAPSHSYDETRLELELKALAEEFRRITGHFPTPLFPLPRLSPPQLKRYAHLRQVSTEKDRGKIMLVASLKDVQELLYDLLRSISVLTSFLGPKRLSISIIEGPSSDETAHILEEVLWPCLIRFGVDSDDIHLDLHMEEVDWSRRNRIEQLADLRNQALSPVWEDHGLNFDGLPVNSSITGRTAGKGVEVIVFFNDVYFNAGQILELIHQHVKSGADTAPPAIMTNAMDYRAGNVGEETFFYDVWVARTAETGDLFRDFPHEGDGQLLFRGHEQLIEKYDKLQPFAAYCAWNGIAVIDPKVFLPPYNIRFRRSNQTLGECAASECSLFCKDLWSSGLGRIQVIPSVRVSAKLYSALRQTPLEVAYDMDLATRTLMETEDAQASNGWHEGVPPSDLDTGVKWPERPPPWVKCYP